MTSQKKLQACFAQISQAAAKGRTENPTQARTARLVLLILYRLAHQPGRSVRTKIPTQEQIFWQEYVQRRTAGREDLARHGWRQVQQWLSWQARQMQIHHESIFFLESLQPDWLPRKQRLLYRLSCGLIFGLLGGVIGYLLAGEPGVLVGSLFVALLSMFDRETQPVPIYAWSWRRAWARLPGRLLLGLLAGLGGACIYGLLVGLSAGPVLGFFYMIVIGLPAGLARGVPLGILGGLLGAVMSGFTGTPARARTRRITTASLAGGLFGGLLGGLLGEILEIATGQAALVLPGMLAGMICGMLALGQWGIIQHLLLRFWLWQSHCLPWQPQRFLRAAAAVGLLRESGRGYRFMHHLFFDYLVHLDPALQTKVPATLPVAPTMPFITTE